MDIKKITQKKGYDPKSIHQFTLSYRNESEGIAYDIIGDSSEKISDEMEALIEKAWNDRVAKFILDNKYTTNKHIILNDCFSDFLKLEFNWWNDEISDVDYFIETVMNVYGVTKIGIVDEEMSSISLVSFEVVKNGEYNYNRLIWKPISGVDMNDVFKEMEKEWTLNKN